MSTKEKTDRLARVLLAVLDQGFSAEHFDSSPIEGEFSVPERVMVRHRGVKSGHAAKVTIDATGRLVCERANSRSCMDEVNIVARIVDTINLRERTFAGLCASGDTRALLVQERFPDAVIGVLPGDVFAVCMVTNAKWTDVVVCTPHDGHPVAVRYALLRKGKVTARVYEKRTKYRSATDVLAAFKRDHARSYTTLIAMMADEVAQ